MRRLLIVGWVLMGLAAGALAAEPVRKPYGIEKRELWTTGNIHGTPEPPDPYTIERAFSKVQLFEPLSVGLVPGTNRFGVATREQIDMGALQRGAKATLVAAERPRLPGTRTAPANVQHSLDRNRRVATALQFGFLVAAGMGAAAAAAVTVHGSLAGTFQAVADQLRR